MRRLNSADPEEKRKQHLSATTLQSQYCKSFFLFSALHCRSQSCRPNACWLSCAAPQAQYPAGSNFPEMPNQQPRLVRYKGSLGPRSPISPGTGSTGERHVRFSSFCSTSAKIPSRSRSHRTAMKRLILVITPDKRVTTRQLNVMTSPESPIIVSYSS